MTREEFEKIVDAEPALAGPIRNAAKAVPSPVRHTFGPMTEAAAIALLFPVAVFVVRNIGLPWLHEVSRYSELWRQKFHAWIDGEHRKHGLDPDSAEAAGEALRSELEAITDTSARHAWEQFRDVLRKDDSDQ